MEADSNADSLRDEKIRKRSNFNTESDPILFFYLLRKNLPWFGLVIILSMSAVFIYLRYTTPVYESNLKFQVGSENTANRVLDVNDFHETRTDLAKDVQILKSKLLFKRALQRLPLDVTFFNQGEILDHELYTSTPIKVNYAIKDSSILTRKFFVEFLDDHKFRLSTLTKEIGVFKYNEKN